MLSLVRWCRDCGLDLSLSDNPMPLDETEAICDTCQERYRVRYGDQANEKLLARQAEIEQLEEEIEDMEEEIEDMEEEIGSLEDEIDGIRSEIRKVERKIADLRK